MDESAEQTSDERFRLKETKHLDERFVEELLARIDYNESHGAGPWDGDEGRD